MFDDDDFIPAPKWDDEDNYHDNNHDDFSERDNLHDALYGYRQSAPYLDEWIEQDIRDAYGW